MKVVNSRASMCAALTLTIFSLPAVGMEFRDVSQDGGRQVIEASGPIELEDAERFEVLANTYARGINNAERPLLRLNSAGGHVVGGITLGMTIRTLGFDTDVEEGATCASACTFAFLGGVSRTIAVRSEAILRDWDIITDVNRPNEVLSHPSALQCQAAGRSNQSNELSQPSALTRDSGCFGARYDQLDERILSALEAIGATKRFPDIVAEQSRWVAFRNRCAAVSSIPQPAEGESPHEQPSRSAAMEQSAAHGAQRGCLEFAYEKRVAELEALVRYLDVESNPEVRAGWKALH